MKQWGKKKLKNALNLNKGIKLEKRKFVDLTKAERNKNEKVILMYAKNKQSQQKEIIYE